ncbi:hypothetical protein Tco_0715627 [Tanacetum coccineum]
MHTARGDGIAGIKRHRRNPSGDGVRKMTTASGRSRLKRGSRIIYVATTSGFQSDAIVTTSRYVVPTSRVKVPAGRYVVPTGKDNVIVSTGRSKVIPAGRTILVLVVRVSCVFKKPMVIVLYNLNIGLEDLSMLGPYKWYQAWLKALLKKALPILQRHKNFTMTSPILSPTFSIPSPSQTFTFLSTSEPVFSSAISNNITQSTVTNNMQNFLTLKKDEYETCHGDGVLDNEQNNMLYQRETKARTDNAFRFGGNDESNKMRKSMLKQEFSEFRLKSFLRIPLLLKVIPLIALSTYEDLIRLENWIWRNIRQQMA